MAQCPCYWSGPHTLAIPIGKHPGSHGSWQEALGDEGLGQCERRLIPGGSRALAGAKLACFRQHERGRAAKSSGPGPGAVVCTRCDSRIARIAKGPPTAAPAPKATRGQCDRCHKDFKLSSLKSRVLDAGKDLVYSCSTCYSKAVKKRALAAANASKKGRSELGSCCCRPLSTPTLKAQALFLLSLLEDSSPTCRGAMAAPPSQSIFVGNVYVRICTRLRAHVV